MPRNSSTLRSAWKPLAQGAAAVAVSQLVTPVQPLDAAQLPVPCIGTACVSSPGGPPVAGFVTSGKATAVQSGNLLSVNQTSTQAILNWASFNVSADGKVQFNQPSATSVALNRIYQQNPSSIFGSVTANGQIYLINPNGFVFGSTATVNTSGLIASSLGISDSTFSQGLLSPNLILNQQPALQSDGRPYVEDNQGNPVLGANGQPLPVQVVVQPGAQLSTPGGRLLLAAPNVTNGGSLSAPDGQVVLAAGQAVFLQASSDPNLRGLIVEVDQGGKAWNQLTGALSADRGNVSMVGLMVNEDGRISATTSVSANGSVRLEAADTVNFGNTQIEASNAGTLELGAKSNIDLEPDLTSTATATSADAQPVPVVTLIGNQVLLEGGSITARGGDLTVEAVSDPSAPVSAGGPSTARVRIHPGTSIDLAGTSVELPMSDNLIAVQLRANELADDPAQRNGALRGQTVYIDTRTGTSIIGAAALAAAEATVPESVSQRLTGGGTATFISEGDVVVSQGATINVSGGVTTYDGGVIQPSYLIGANGKAYNIGTANPLTTYSGVLNPTFTADYNKWGVQSIVAVPGLSEYQPGYVQGASAGSVEFAAPTMLLEGTLVGQAVNGPYQRSGSAVASGGTLILGVPGGLSSVTSANEFLTPAISFSSGAVPVVADDSASILPQPLAMPIQYLTQGGFQHTDIFGDTTVTLPAGLPLNMLPGSSLSITAPRTIIDSDITTLGGSIQITSTVTTMSSDPGVGRPGIVVGDGVVLDVRGQWTNESMDIGAPLGSGPTLQNGGQIDLTLGNGLVEGGEIVIGNDVSLRASGGAWLSNSNSLTPGQGGSIAIQALPLDSALQLGSNIEIDAFGVDGAQGGSFALGAPRILLGASSSAGWESAQRIDDLTNPGGVLRLNGNLLSDYGFSAVSLEATGPQFDAGTGAVALSLVPDAHLSALTETLQLVGNYLLRPSGGVVAGFDQTTTLAPSLRQPMTIALAASVDAPGDPLTAGLLEVPAGSSLTADAGSTISLAGLGGVYVDGTLRAKGGSILLSVPIPTESGDLGYQPSQVLELAPGGVLDVSGALIPAINNLGLALGTVLPGGTVQLAADRGYVVTEPGSVIDIAGGSSALDVQTYQGSGAYLPRLVGSSAGSLSVNSPESISLLGRIEAAAGAGNYGDPAGGALDVALTRNEFPPSLGVGATPLPDVPLTVQLVGSNSTAAASAPDSGLAILGVSQLKSWGIDSLTLTADNLIEFSTSMPLGMTRQVVLNSPTVTVDPGVNASIAANLIEFANPYVPTPVPVTAGGTGALTAHAQQIDLVGEVGLQGVGSLTLVSSGDVELIGNSELLQALSIEGSLVVDAARIYPSTLCSCALTALGAGNSITIGQTDASPGVPLSAAASLTITADRIDTAGTLLAPFGTIDLNAGTALTLEPGSVTSVSAAGAVIPFGQTEFGQQSWVYGVPGSTPQTISGIPQRQVLLQAPSVTLAKGATVDVSGGGNLYAYEWVPGTGGTTDALAANGSGLYAIIPSLGSAYAPYDPQEYATSTLTQGNSIYLSGGGGVPAGTYALLPARYALLPGAFLVQLQAGFTNMAPGVPAALADGTPIIAGYESFGTTGLHAGGYQGFAVWPGSYGQQLAQYDDSYASTFFAAAAAKAGQPAPPSPADAGALSISAGTYLGLQGSVLTNPSDSSGKYADVDISSTALEITAGAATGAPAGTVTVSAATIDGWHVGELILGGHPNTDGSSITVNADSVTLAPGAQLQAGSVILVAGQTVDLQRGSAILSNSAAAGGSAPKSLPVDDPVTLTGPQAGGAAFLAVSDATLPIVSAPPATGTPGTLDIESGATVASLGAISLNAPVVELAGTLRGPGAAWSLASSSIGFVGTSSSAGESLQINPATLAQMQTAGSLQLTSAGALDLDVPVTLGSEHGGTPAISSIALSAQSLNNLAGTATSAFTAGTVILGGSGSGASQPAAGAGTLVFTGEEIDVGPGTLPVTGVAATRLVASELITGQGAGGIETSGNLTLTAPYVAAQSGGQTLFSAPSGTLAINAASGGVALQPTTYIGGELDFSAAAIEQSGRVVAYSGNVDMQATGDLTLGKGATIDVSGPTLGIGDQIVGAEGGRVNLTAGGDLTLAAGSRIDVAAGAAAPAGSLSLTAGGALDLAGALSARGGSGEPGGSISIDAGSLAQSLSALGGDFAAAGFNSQIDVLVHSGDLLLASGASITANQITLTADGGGIEIAGTISAPGANLRGEIGLFGATGVQLDAGGALYANSKAGNAGGIELGAGSSGQITLDPGSTVAATGTTGDGSLLLRAPLSASGTDVSVQLAGSNLSGLGQIIVEPVFTESVGAAPTAADWSTIESSVAGTMAVVAPNVTNRLNPACSGSGCAPLLPLVVRAAVDVTSPGDLTLASEPTLSAWQFNGQPADFTIRATGSLTVAATLSDGFTALRHGIRQPTPTELTPNYQSATIRLVAGADAASPDPLAVVDGAAADLTIEPGVVVRTSTGEIDLVAARDLIFAGAGASAYTAGTVGAPSAQLPGTTSVFNFPTDGGNLTARAGRDVVGVPVSQGVSAWQIRQGDTNISEPTEWGVDFLQFGWNLGALGGGDASVTAGRNIDYLSVAAADSYGYPTGSTSPVLFSSGGLAVNAGGDIGSSQFFAADGRSLLSAGGGFTTLMNPETGTPLGSSIALENAQVSVEARTGAVIEAVTNPTTMTQNATEFDLQSSFFTYTDASSVSVRSSSGDIDFNADLQSIAALLGNAGGGFGATVYPPSLYARALTGNLNLNWGGGAFLLPSDSGQLVLLAGKDINNTGFMTMADGFAFNVPTAQAPGPDGTVPNAIFLAPFDSGRHIDDPQPALIEAGGDINGLQVSIPKAAEVIAGQDITDLQLMGQNLNSSDVTLISAGRDFTVSPAGLGAQVEVGGPGQVDVLAGRDVDLGFSLGISTVGNLLNPNLLTSTGANLTVLAGVGRGPDYTGFYDTILAGNSGLRQDLVQYVEGLTGTGDLTFAQATGDFDALNPNVQHAYLNGVFFSELNDSGIAANQPGGNFDAGYAAIDALFPGSRGAASPYGGDLSLTFSRIYTLSGGDINLLVPGGAIDVGLANPPPSLGASKTPSELGIVAEGSGDVNIYSLADVNVNASRIFTLGGGNILIWSTEGSIDAGKGAKSSISAPPPQILVDSAGNITIDFGGAVAGSGIRTIQVEPTTPPGNVDLIAPVGTVNAGDAGIGASGNINIAAEHVVGLNNIQFGGTATGVPAQVSDIGLSVSGASGAANSATSSSTSSVSSAAAAQAGSSPLAQNAMNWLDVFVIGLGEENCATSDMECLKRQRQ